MKRRGFLKGSAGLLVGAIGTRSAWAQTKPCPPPRLDVAGGDSVVSSCDDSAESDWIARSTGTGVVWAHDFRYQAEVNAFNDRGETGTAVWRAGDGITGNHCLEMTIPTGGTAVGGWWRPFSRLAAGDNGLPYDDPGAAGTVRLRSDWYYTAGVNSSTPASKWQGGIYSHPDYWGNSDLNPALGPEMFDGHDFYIQMRVKIQATRWTAGNPAGKLCFISSMRKSNPNQELVVQSQNIWPWAEDAPSNIFRMYTNNGNQFNSQLNDPQSGGNGSLIQPNGPFDATCVAGGPDQICWYWPIEEWVTVLIHVTPGHQSTNGTLNDPAAADTGIEVWVAEQGATAYTKIWEKMDYIWEFGGAYTPAYSEDSGEGFSGFIASGYMNNVNAVEGWYQRFDQIIFSKEFIPCPQV